MYLLSDLEQPLWSPSNINKQVKLLPSLLCSHVAGHGSHQRAGPHWVNGKLPQVLVTDLLSTSSLACLLLILPTSQHDQQARYSPLLGPASLGFQ